METELKDLEARLRRVAEMIVQPAHEQRPLSRIERDLVLENLRSVYDAVSLFAIGETPTLPSEGAPDSAMTADEVHSAAMMVTMAAMSRPDVDGQAEATVADAEAAKPEAETVVARPRTLFDAVDDEPMSPAKDESIAEEVLPVVEQEEVATAPLTAEVAIDLAPVAESQIEVVEPAPEPSEPEPEVVPEVDDNQLLFEDIEFEALPTMTDVEENVDDRTGAEEETPVEDAVDVEVAQEIVLNVEVESPVAEPEQMVAPAVELEADVVETAIEAAKADVEPDKVEAEETATPEFHLPVEPPAALADMPLNGDYAAQSQPQGTILDYLRRPSGTPAGARTLGEAIGQSQQQPSFAMPKVDDLRTVININDKFSFMSELFGGNIKAYNDFIVRLNAMSSREEALAEVEQVARQNHWNADSQVVKTFHKIFDKKF